MDQDQTKHEYTQAHGWIDIFQLTQLDLCDTPNKEANHIRVKKVRIGD